MENSKANVNGNIVDYLIKLVIRKHSAIKIYSDCSSKKRGGINCSTVRVSVIISSCVIFIKPSEQYVTLIALTWLKK